MSGKAAGAGIRRQGRATHAQETAQELHGLRQFGGRDCGKRMPVVWGRDSEEVGSSRSQRGGQEKAKEDLVGHMRGIRLYPESVESH